MLLPPLHAGVLLERRKRFLADVRLDDGREVVAHCPNPGRMTACMRAGGRVWLSHQPSPRRRLEWSWELSEMNGTKVLVNTMRPNNLLAEALEAGRVPELADYNEIRREARVDDGTRLDFLLANPSRGTRCFVEVKSVTLRVESGEGAFPDSVSVRARRHVESLADRIEEGDRAVLMFLVGRGDVAHVRPADEIDPLYGETLRRAVKSGVEVFARRLSVSLDSLHVSEAVPVVL